MGEDRSTCTEKKPNDVLPCRHRHSSVISSCSEDAESESTSAGYPPTPDEDREQELEYGPGIVNKLRTRFLSITLKQNRGMNMRRSCSMENLLDQDRPSRGHMFSAQKRLGINGEETEDHKDTVWGNLKRAKSMDTLLMDLQTDPTPVKDLHQEVNGEVKKEPKIIRRRDGGLNRTIPIISDEELPKPDTVKTYKRMFEPAESRRGSHSRRPPVLRASAKSGAALKMNGVSSSSSAKVNGTSSKSKFSAKLQSPPVKAQSSPEPVKCLSPIPKETIVNGEGVKPMCNGSHVVKATPIKISDLPLCNGKETEKELNVINLCMSKKDGHFVHKPDVICNGNAAQKELMKVKNNEESLNQSNKCSVNNIVNGINSKPKVAPNRPAFLKNPKPLTTPKPSPKIIEQKKIEKNLLISKLKSNLEEGSKKSPEKEVESKTEMIQKNPASPINQPEISSLIDSDLKSEEIKDVSKDNKKEEAKQINVKTKDEGKLLEENNRKNSEKSCSETHELIKPISTPEKKLLNGFGEHPESKDSEKTKGSKLEKVMDVAKSDNKPVKKSQATAPPTTSMVFDFRGKDVVPHVAVLPVPFGCKALHPRKRPLMIDGKETPNGNGVASDDEDDDYVDYSVPPPSGVTFEGENVKIGRGSILSTRNKDLKITFDDDVDKNTFIYPSETSLMDETDRSGSPSAADNEIIPNGQPPPSKLKSNTTIGSQGAGGLSTYTPSVLRTMDNFQPGMFRPPPEKEEEKNRQNSEEEENTEVREQSEDPEMLKPADPDIISSWSLSAGTSDLLF